MPNASDRKLDRLFQRFQALSCTEREQFLGMIGMMGGGNAHLLSNVLKLITQAEKMSVVSIGSEAGEALLQIAFLNPGTPFWQGCLRDVPSQNLENAKCALEVALKARKDKVEEERMGMDWMDLEKLLATRKK